MQKNNKTKNENTWNLGEGIHPTDLLNGPPIRFLPEDTFDKLEASEFMNTCFFDIKKILDNKNLTDNKMQDLIETYLFNS